MTILLWVGLSFLVAYYWQTKGRSFGWGFVTSMFLSPPVAMVVGLVLNPNREMLEQHKLESGQYKTCPQCAELVRQQAKLCRFCKYEFGDPHYEELKQRVEVADRIRAQLVHEHHGQLPDLNRLLKRKAHQILGLPEDFRGRGNTYSSQKLQKILKSFPNKETYQNALERFLQEMLTQTECPFCHTLQPQENLVCTNCYMDLKQLNPETGEIEPLNPSEL